MQNQPSNQTRAAVHQIDGKTPPTGYAAADQRKFIPHPTNKKHFSEGVAMRQPPVASSFKQTRKRSGQKKEKIVTRINLPEAVVQWIDNTFQGKERNTAYQYAFAAHLQVNKIPQRKNYDYICLPKTTLAKYITDKNICSIKKRFAEGKVIYQNGWKQTINGKYMHKYSFNEDMFLSSLVNVDISSFKRISTQEHPHNVHLPLLSYEEKGGVLVGDYMWCNLPGSGQTLNNLTIKNHKTMKKEISYEQVLMLKNQGLTHEQIGEMLHCSSKKIQRVLRENEVDNLDRKMVDSASVAYHVDSKTKSDKPSAGWVDNGRVGRAAPSSQLDSGQCGSAYQPIEVNQVDSGSAANSSTNHVIDADFQGGAPNSDEHRNPVPKHPTSANDLVFTKKQLQEYTLKNLQSFKIDLPKLESLIPDRVKANVDKIQTISSSQNSIHIAYRFMGSDTIYRGTTYTILREKVKEGESLIKYKDEYFIGNLNKFKEKKRKDVEFSLRQALQSLSNPDCYRAHINDTNGRLDSTLTNLWDGFKQQILHDNDYCEIDIVCSQMAFFASHLKKTTNYILFRDAINFIYDAESGVLYETVAKELKIDRNAAKHIMFHVLFSHYKTNDLSITKFKQQYPDVYDYIYRWKKKNGSECFSIMLQKMESEMMINCVLKEFMDRGFMCLTVHDSVICKKSQVEEVMDIMKDIFKKHDFKCALFSKYHDMDKPQRRERPGREFYPDAPNQAERILTEEDCKLSWTEEEKAELDLLFEKIAQESKQPEAEKSKAGEAPESELPFSRDDEEFEEKYKWVGTQEDEDEWEELQRSWQELTG